MVRKGYGFGREIQYGQNGHGVKHELGRRRPGGHRRRNVEEDRRSDGKRRVGYRPDECGEEVCLIAINGGFVQSKMCTRWLVIQ